MTEDGKIYPVFFGIQTLAHPARSLVSNSTALPRHLRRKYRLIILPVFCLILKLVSYFNQKIKC